MKSFHGLPWEDDVEAPAHGYKLLAQISDALSDLLMQNDDLRRQAAEGRHYRKQYMDLLNSSTAHSRDMLGGLLAVAMKPGVMDAISAANLLNPKGQA